MGAKAIGLSEGQWPFSVALAIGTLIFAMKFLITKWNVTEWIVNVILLIVGAFIYFNNGHFEVLAALFVAIGIKGVPIKRAVKVVLAIWGTLFAFTVVRALLGFYPGVINTQTKLGMDFGIIRYSLGFTHPNVLHMTYLIIVLLVLYCSERKGKKFLLEVLLLFVGNLYIFLYSVSYTGFITVCFCLGLFLLLSVIKRPMNGVITVAGLVFVFACILFPILGSYLLSENLFSLADKVINGRMTLVNKTFTMFKPQLLGSKIDLNEYGLNLDCSYAYMLFYHGILCFVIFVISFSMTLFSALKRGDKKCAGLLIGLALAGVTEQFMGNLSFKNIGLLFIGDFCFNHFFQNIGGVKLFLLSSWDRGISLQGLDECKTRIVNYFKGTRWIECILPALLLGFLFFVISNSAYTSPKNVYQVVTDEREGIPFKYPDEISIDEDESIVIGELSAGCLVVPLEWIDVRLESLRSKISITLWGVVLGFILSAFVANIRKFNYVCIEEVVDNEMLHLPTCRLLGKDIVATNSSHFSDFVNQHSDLLLGKKVHLVSIGELLKHETIDADFLLPRDYLIAYAMQKKGMLQADSVKYKELKEGIKAEYKDIDISYDENKCTFYQKIMFLREVFKIDNSKAKVDKDNGKKRLLIYAHYYAPDVASTGQILTELAEGLLESFDITVIAVVPSYGGTIENAYKWYRYYQQEYHGVHVVRVRVPEFTKSNKLSRARNILSYFFRARRITRKVGPQEYVLSISQPPILGGMLGLYGSRVKKAKFIYNIQDFNPEQIESVSYSKNRFVISAMKYLDCRSCNKSDLVITVGRDLVDTLKSRFDNGKVPDYVMINNWIDEKLIHPISDTDENVLAFKEKYGLTDKFVFMYSGNIGLYYDLDNIFSVLEKIKPGTRTQDGRDVVFAFVGDGGRRKALEEYALNHGMSNVVFIPYQSKENLVYSLNAADIHICTNANGIKGVSCPSKYYGIAAVGKPVLASLEKGTEIRAIIEETNGGLVSDPEDYVSFYENVIKFINLAGSEELQKMGARSRYNVEKHLGKNISIERYREEILNIDIQKDYYKVPRQIQICNVVGLCPLTREAFIDLLFNVPKAPVSATVSLVGMPAIISAKENPRYARMYNESTIAAIDGMPFVKKARRKGFECERCSGPDIMGSVFERGVAEGTRHFFYGGKNDEVLQKIRNNLEKNYPGINIVGMYSPPFRELTEEEDEKIVKEINELTPDFIWVGIGAPRQEMWMYRHRESIHNACMLGVGAGFDFIAGTLAKAPAWMETAGIEWFYRLSKEPKRLWKRYILGGVKYIWYSLEAWIFPAKE